MGGEEGESKKGNLTLAIILSRSFKHLVSISAPWLLLPVLIVLVIVSTTMTFAGQKSKVQHIYPYDLSKPYKIIGITPQWIQPGSNAMGEKTQVVISQGGKQHVLLGSHGISVLLKKRYVTRSMTSGQYIPTQKLGEFGPGLTQAADDEGEGGETLLGGEGPKLKETK